MKVKTRVKSGGLGSINHNRTRLVIRTAVKAGGLNSANHNRTRL